MAQCQRMYHLTAIAENDTTAEPCGIISSMSLSLVTVAASEADVEYLIGILNHA
jgi:hypothetical protein